MNTDNLRAVSELPQQYQHVFSDFQFFNLIQSQLLDEILHSDTPVVISAPTGSGKTALFELAIIRLLEKCQNNDSHIFDLKIVYMAPVKALCTERFNDWENKFQHLGLKAIEVTGDSDEGNLLAIQHFNLVLTTPEKWDSLTRKWRDHISLVSVIKLFLIDEVHLLNENKRGSTLEAVVSRMKTVHETSASCIRFIALSATIPNIEDLGIWLGTKFSPAKCFTFGEETRPVRLNKIVKGFPFVEKMSYFKFDLSLSYKLKQIILDYSEGKPTLVFCSTRKSVLQTSATLIQNLTFHFTAVQKITLDEARLAIVDTKLREMVHRGIGFHHAGLLASDRRCIENLFRSGFLPVLICTTTLAMGVNLPAHLVIIKATAQYINGAWEEYSEGQVLQMMGRAGRPQFDTSATAVVLTKSSMKDKYEKLLLGNARVESNLHKNLAEHLNSEIVLGTITDIAVAVHWIRSTFLYVRALKNPRYYGIPDGLSPPELEARLQAICLRELNALEKYELVKKTDFAYNVQPTENGKLMARLYLAFETMKIFMKVKGTETLPELLELICMCHEFNDIQLRVNEKTTLNRLNNMKNRESIRFILPGKIKSRDMKVNCLLQAYLGCLPIADASLAQESNKIAQISERIVKALSLYLWQKDFYFALQSALILAKCLSARIWENSIYLCRQLPGIGPALSSLLVAAKKTTIKAVINSNPRDLERILNKHPPFGNNLQEAAKCFPIYEMELTYREMSNKVYITIKLLNVESILNINHTCSLLVADADNKLLHKEKIRDSQLITHNGIYVVNVHVPLGVTSISAHLISDTLVGSDVKKKISLIKEKRGLSEEVQYENYYTSEDVKEKGENKLQTNLYQYSFTPARNKKCKLNYSDDDISHTNTQNTITIKLLDSKGDKSGSDSPVTHNSPSTNNTLFNNKYSKDDYNRCSKSPSNSFQQNGNINYLMNKSAYLNQNHELKQNDIRFEKSSFSNLAGSKVINKSDTQNYQNTEEQANSEAIKESPIVYKMHRLIQECDKTSHSNSTGVMINEKNNLNSEIKNNSITDVGNEIMNFCKNRFSFQTSPSQFLEEKSKDVRSLRKTSANAHCSFINSNLIASQNNNSGANNKQEEHFSEETLQSKNDSSSISHLNNGNTITRRKDISNYDKYQNLALSNLEGTVISNEVEDKNIIPSMNSMTGNMKKNVSNNGHIDKNNCSFNNSNPGESEIRDSISEIDDLFFDSPVEQNHSQDTSSCEDFDIKYQELHNLSPKLKFSEDENKHEHDRKFNRNLYFENDEKTNKYFSHVNDYNSQTGHELKSESSSPRRDQNLVAFRQLEPLFSHKRLRCDYGVPFAPIHNSMTPREIVENSDKQNTLTFSHESHSNVKSNMPLNYKNENDSTCLMNMLNKDKNSIYSFETNDLDFDNNAIPSMNNIKETAQKDYYSAKGYISPIKPVLESVKFDKREAIYEKEPERCTIRPFSVEENTPVHNIEEYKRCIQQKSPFALGKRKCERFKSGESCNMPLTALAHLVYSSSSYDHTTSVTTLPSPFKSISTAYKSPTDSGLNYVHMNCPTVNSPYKTVATAYRSPKDPGLNHFHINRAHQDNSNDIQRSAQHNTKATSSEFQPYSLHNTPQVNINVSQINSNCLLKPETVVGSNNNTQQNLQKNHHRNAKILQSGNVVEFNQVINPATNASHNSQLNFSYCFGKTTSSGKINISQILLKQIKRKETKEHQNRKRQGSSENIVEHTPLHMEPLSMREKSQATEKEFQATFELLPTETPKEHSTFRLNLHSNRVKALTSELHSQDNFETNFIPVAKELPRKLKHTSDSCSMRVTSKSFSIHSQSNFISFSDQKPITSSLEKMHNSITDPALKMTSTNFEQNCADNFKPCLVQLQTNSPVKKPGLLPGLCPVRVKSETFSINTQESFESFWSNTKYILQKNM